jgi:hypothetical protein
MAKGPPLKEIHTKIRAEKIPIVMRSLIVRLCFLIFLLLVIRDTLPLTVDIEMKETLW